MTGILTRMTALSTAGKTFLALTVLVTGAASGAATAHAAPTGEPLTSVEQTADENAATDESGENIDTQTGPTGENNEGPSEQ